MIRLGLDVHEAVLSLGPAERRALLARVAAAGLDHVVVADHVSFHGGTGFDGMVSATGALASNDDLDVWISVYQLALRHPLTVARQLSSIAQIAPGRLTLGVGVGGEDRSEVTNCGVDPTSRGRRLDESLEVLAALSTGEAVDHDGAFFHLDSAAVRPAPQPRVPVLIGGSSDAAIRRAGRYGDGWLGIFVSVRRFERTVEAVRAAAVGAGRQVDWFGLHVWCGIDPRPGVGRTLLADQMQRLYHLPYERFENVTATGSASEVAEWLMPYVKAGGGHVTLTAMARDWQAGVDQAAEVKERLAHLLG
jgi:alkanesulfonate monooxygenase SsuD/methylene tetrahydromethanopterin reductase-like flavin-dependent oxidoreductase (luciferase family)